MKVISTPLEGVVIVEPDVFGDDRGFFMETWHAHRYHAHGLPEVFVQDNVSFSQKGVLRGLHFQNPSPQGKLVTVLQGEVFDVAVDIRRGSVTFGKWVGEVISSENKRQLYVPEGFAHGFLVLSDQALVNYKCTTFYDKQADAGIRWDDPDIGIEWPVDEPVLSAKDASAPCLSDLSEERLFSYEKENKGATLQEKVIKIITPFVK